MKRDGAKTIVLVCTHIRLFRYAPPRVGERIWCVPCGDLRAVVGGSGAWRAVCDDCTFKRTYQSPTTLRRAVAEHLQRAPVHTLTIWQVGASDTYKVKQMQATDGMPLLDGIDSPDTLPFKR